MSDESELNRLRADLEKFASLSLRYRADVQIRDHQNYLRNKIAELEAAADPWREAKQFASAYRDPKGSSYLQKLIAHYDHLSAEVARLTERVAELEDVKPIADMPPPFEDPIVGVEPVLDPARVLATACGIMGEQGWIMNDRVREELKCGAKPYPLKKGGE